MSKREEAIGKRQLAGAAAPDTGGAACCLFGGNAGWWAQDRANLADGLADAVHSGVDVQGGLVGGQSPAVLGQVNEAVAHGGQSGEVRRIEANGPPAVSERFRMTVGQVVGDGPLVVSFGKLGGGANDLAE